MAFSVSVHIGCVLPKEQEIRGALAELVVVRTAETPEEENASLWPMWKMLQTVPFSAPA